MKIYTSEISQFGKTLLVLNQEVTFDRVGCAEVEESFGKEVIKYAPDWYSKDKKELKKEVKAVDEDSQMKDVLIEELQEKIAKLRKMDEGRVSAFNEKESEKRQIREEMGKVVVERDALKTELEGKEEVWKKEKEQLDYKYELAFLSTEELLDTCYKLEIDTKTCVKKGKKDEEPTIDKKGLIELIIKAAE